MPLTHSSTNARAVPPPALRRRPLRAAAALLLTVLCAAGCADPGTPAVARPSLRPAAGEPALPVNAYLPTTAEAFDTGRARALLIDRCMRAYGFGFPRPSARLERTSLLDGGVYGNKRRYGIADPAMAAEYGYHLAGTLDQKARGRIRVAGAPGSRDPRYLIVLNGPGEGADGQTTVKGRKVRPGGCAARASERLVEKGSATGSFSYGQLAADIKADSFRRSLRDPAVRAAVRAWAACMKKAGYTVASPVTDAPYFDLDEPTVSRKEIAMARTDVGCKERTRLVRVWSEAEAGYQRRRIAQNAEALDRVRREQRSRTAAVARVLREA
ncbi:hypothetical protein ACH4ZX_28105 [Streptomyces sp. NPDC020490]|uniref:hypothetical protein n=1 Tax=Streptomyces sp. NPDC020490 TaxID=3365078 RepID=UPI0037976886